MRSSALSSDSTTPPRLDSDTASASRNRPDRCRVEGLARWATAGCLSLAGCGPASPAAPARAAWFVDHTRELGVDFRFQSGATGRLYLTEVMGGGLGLFDSDGDGDLDLFLVNGGLDPVNGTAIGSSVDRLYENRAIARDAERGAPARFVDVTDGSGLGDGGYGMGLAVGDIDNDADLDLVVTNLGSVQLYRNDGSGRFEDVSSAAGIEVPGWSCSASFLDYDRDGFLDLYVTRYVVFDPTVECKISNGRVDYCSPAAFEFTSDVLLHNEGAGRFTDASARAGITAVKAPGLGVVCADLDDDGWTDVYVANDGQPNQLWINQRDGTFRDAAFQMGAAVNMNGRAEAGMGVLVADLDGNTTLDLFITHLENESNTLYLNRGGGRGFYDATGRCGLGVSSIPFTGFGVAALDVELDGDLDLLVVNGRVTRGEPRRDSVAPPPWDRLAEPGLFYLNEGNGRFALKSDLAGELVSSVEVSRGLAVGDLDLDGDLDVAINHIESPARVYVNEAPRQGRWLIVRAVDPRLRRDAIGARVTVRAGGRQFVRCIESSSSYLASNDPRAHYGLGRVERIEAIEVAWPDGLRETFRIDCVDCAVELHRGEGEEVR